MRIRALAAQLLIALTLAACGSGAAPEAGREIVILGVMGSAGSDRPQVAGMVRGVQMAVDEYNGNPDFRYEIELREFDTQATPGEAGAGESEIANAQRLIGLVGPFALDEVQALGPALSNIGMPYMVPNVTATAIPQEGWRSFRRMVANDRREGALLAVHAAGRVTGGIALITEDSDAGGAFAAGAAEALQGIDRSLSRTDKVEAGTTPTTLAGVLTEAAPEAVLYGGGGETAKAFLDALRQAGYQGVMVASHQLRELNPDGVGGGVVSASVGIDMADPAASRFAGSYRDEFDAAPPTFSLEAYEGAWMIIEALEEVEESPRDITTFLRLNPRFRGDSKRYDFDEQGEPTNPPVWIYESADGRWRLAGRTDG